VTRLQLADRVMKARKTSTCPLCNGPISVGQRIARTGTTWQHASCLIRSITEKETAR
jgi:hypothetical protein